MQTTLVIPFSPATAARAEALARSASAPEILLAGPGRQELGGGRARLIAGASRGDALRAAFQAASHPITVVCDAGASFSAQALSQVAAPVQADTADVVFASTPWGALPRRALAAASRLLVQSPVSDPFSGLLAARTDVLRALRLVSSGEEIVSELLAKLAAGAYRLAEVRAEGVAPVSARAAWSHLRTLARYAFLQNDADNAHEGYNTLLRMEAAPRYNAWIGRRMREHLGPRVLEVGAGIGTITREIERGRELLIALEMDRFYVDRLRNLFRDKPHVRPHLADVAGANWESLERERIDSVVLSNVLEHIQDDAAAVQGLRRVLPAGGKLVVLVPALPALFGSIDEAVGHFRRYTPQSLRKVLETHGFAVEKLEWMNLVGIPGWFLNGRVLRRRAVPPLQLRLYDALAPLLAQAESRVRLPLGLSLFAVARAEDLHP